MKKIFSIILIGILTVSLFTGCSQKKVSVENNDVLKGTIAVVGSTSVTPVAQNLADKFMSIHPEVKIDVQGIGSSAGIKAASNGSADIGMASRNLKEKEKEWGLTQHVIAYDGIAVVVNPNNPVKELTKEQIAKIFKGEIKNWKEVGGPDKEILVVSREAGSGTRGAFEEIVGIENAVREDALVAEGNGAVKANVASKEYAIGYLSFAYLDDSVKALKVDGAEPTVENIKAGNYKISRPFLMVTKGEIKPAAKAYLDFILSDEGQKIVGEKLITVK
ncbi:phosphate ABC transporter substrate-binding protein, PhoT family [Caminicella sporogenes DSM 14501]|uniref:Phosphate-binding protein n=1 Tax=Caminicella sporogenes DSM 14501 TaxID=1121266 RepID=A0A1M6QIB2_9FIRM|nr:phosphate ABC transporter substrate-binding protein [Caminicella sporogenes]RKD25306.1 phosphate-binding protein [Caminicella sporogenes]SHK19793.1 phosphate ABC transporter substrate-binding protein, PhoT family [Caminicella sporogenes DSM 14501]